MNKADWEQLVINRITERLEISASRAKGILEKSYFEMTSEWAKGSTPNQTASVLIDHKGL